MIDPLERLASLLDEAKRRGAPEPDGMVLATTTPEGSPSARVVLCRGIDSRGLRFYTNYESRKGDELARNPRAAACFFWPMLDVQVRVEGHVDRLSATESDAYFERRPRGHRLSALVSPQSRPIASIEALRAEAHRIEAEYEGKAVPRPPRWGGYLLSPARVEFWSRGADRLHERVLYTKRDTASVRDVLDSDAHVEAWETTILAP